MILFTLGKKSMSYVTFGSSYEVINCQQPKVRTYIVLSLYVIKMNVSMQAIFLWTPRWSREVIISYFFERDHYKQFQSCVPDKNES